MQAGSNDDSARNHVGHLVGGDHVMVRNRWLVAHARLHKLGREPGAVRDVPTVYVDDWIASREIARPC